MICPKCGKECNDDARFCTGCGEKLSQEAPATPAQPMPPMQPMPQGAPIPPMQPIPPVQPMPQGAPIPPVPPMQPMPQMPYAQPPVKKGNTAAKVVVCVLVALLLVCLGILSAILINKGIQKRTLQTMLETADDFLHEEAYEEAVDSYLALLEKDPENTEAVNGLTNAYLDWAESYVEAGDYDAAIALLEEADPQAKQKKIAKALEEIRESMQGGWTDADMLFWYGSQRIEVERNHSFITYDGEGYLTDYAEDSYETYGECTSGRGLAVGMTLEDYQALYEVEEGYAVWELYSGDSNEYTGFEPYTGQSPEEMNEDANNVWLDIGFCKEAGEWRRLYDYEVRDTWFCDADLDDYEEVVVFAVNLEWNGEIGGISLEYFTYDEAWVEWQDWAE